MNSKHSHSSQPRSRALFLLTTAVFLASASLFFNNPQSKLYDHDGDDDPASVARALSHDDAEAAATNDNDDDHVVDDDQGLQDWESFSPITVEEVSRFRLALEEARRKGGGLVHGTFSDTEPFVHRWRDRFDRAKNRNGEGGIFFFRHIRKVSRTTF